MDKVLFITGQTGTGKTDLALSLAKKYNGELVSFDSRQAYKNLDIITGKEYTDPKTWMLDVYNPKEIITAHDYCEKATLMISDILKRGKLPIVVGGTVFYIKSFLYGVSDFTGEPDWNLRNELEEKSVLELQNILKDLNSEVFELMNNSDVNNKRRLIRKIEIFQSQKSKVKSQNQNSKPKKFDSLVIGLYREKEELVELVENRIEKRIEMGAFAEIENLLSGGFSFSDPGLNTIGYKQLRDFFENKKTKDEVVLDWKRAEIDYARRQLVFMKKVPELTLFNLSGVGQLELIGDLVYKWLYAKG